MYPSIFFQKLSGLHVYNHVLYWIRPLDHLTAEISRSEFIPRADFAVV